MYRRPSAGLQVLLVHPGGPFWARKDAGAWSIPKGEYGPDEDSLTAARREFREELGITPDGDCQPLGDVKQKGGKIVTTLMNSPYEVAVYQLGNQYFGARSTEFGFANYEMDVSPTRP